MKHFVTRNFAAAGYALFALLTAFSLFSARPASAQVTLRSDAHRIQFRNGDVTLTGWLEIPAAAKQPVPVVVLIGGNNTSWTSYDWMFAAMTDAFLRADIGVFYYDHRGDGGSGGNWLYSTYEELADDAIAAVDVIARDRRVDASRVGVWGHSMGGWIAPLVAARSDHVAFVMTASGPGVSPLVQTAYAHMWEDIARGVTHEDAIGMDALRRDLWAYYAQPTERYRLKAQKTLEWAKSRAWFPRVTGWQELQGVSDSIPGARVVNSARFDTALAQLRRDAVYDPVSALQRVRVPMLAMFGGADRVVPVDVSIAAMKSAFEVSGNAKLTTHVFPGANHSVMTGRTPTAAALAPGYLQMMTEWIRNVPPHEWVVLSSDNVRLPSTDASRPVPREYTTKVTLGAGNCPDAGVEDHPTSVTIAGDSITLMHAGQTYRGTIRATRFTTAPNLIDAGDVRYRLTISGTLDDARLEADVKVEKQTTAGRDVCSYNVHWSGRR